MGCQDTHLRPAVNIWGFQTRHSESGIQHDMNKTSALLALDTLRSASQSLVTLLTNKPTIYCATKILSICKAFDCIIVPVSRDTDLHGK